MLTILGLIITALLGIKKGLKNKATGFVLFFLVVIPFVSFVLSCDNAPDVLLPPAAVSASDGEFTDKIELQWNAVENADEYLIYKSSSETGIYGKIATTTNNTYDITNDIDPGTTYWFKVKAENNNGISDFSAADSGYARTTSDGSTSIQDIEDSYIAYMAVLDGIGNEYYIIENKVAQSGTWAEFLPGSGLLITHITDNLITGNSFNSGTAPHGVTIVEADSPNNAGQLWNAYDYDNGSYTDPFYQGNNDSITPTSTPNTDLNNGTDSGLSITEISGTGETMTFKYDFQ